MRILVWKNDLKKYNKHNQDKDTSLKNQINIVIKTSILWKKHSKKCCARNNRYNDTCLKESLLNITKPCLQSLAKITYPLYHNFAISFSLSPYIVISLISCWLLK